MSSAFGFIQILVILLIHLQYLDSSSVHNLVPYLVSCLGAEPLDEVPHLLLRDVGVLDQLNITDQLNILEITDPSFILVQFPWFFLQFLVDKFTLLDPDPHIECGSGSTAL